LWGVYNVTASIRGDSMDNLTEIVNGKLGEITKINSKLTMIVSGNRLGADANLPPFSIQTKKLHPCSASLLHPW